MKKLFWTAAAVAAIFAVTDASAQCCVCGQKINMKADNRAIHQAYQNGAIDFDGVVAGLEETGYNWRVKDLSKKKQAWMAGNEMGQDVTVKLKEGKTKKFVKVDILGEKRMYVKDMNNGKKHAARIREDGKVHMKKNIINEDGRDVLAYEKPAKEKKDKK